MIADRFHVELCEGGAVICHDPDGGFSALHPGDSYWRVIGAIRQQVRDLEQLRGELAAAVAERDEARTAYQVRNTEWHQHELIALALAERYKLRAEQAEARLAAIDGAPTVAIAVHTHTDRGPYKYLSYSELNVPRDGVELIARPTKDHP